MGTGLSAKSLSTASSPVTYLGAHRPRLLCVLCEQGSGVARSPKDAVYYLSAASQIGPWSGWLRRGLNLYLQVCVFASRLQ